MGISGRDLAILSARAGAGRFGASRFGFCPDDVEGSGTTEPGEYVWKERKLAETTWTLQGQCEGNVCGWKPRAAFVASPSTGGAPLAVTFTDESTPAHDLDSWAWDFGDGGSSTSQNPTHTFSATGVYTVTLTVTNSKGSSSTTGTITVLLPTVSGTVTYATPGYAARYPWAGATVELTLDGGSPATAVTDENGLYTFEDVAAGSYSLYVPAQMAGEGWYEYGGYYYPVVEDEDVTVDIDCMFVPG